MNKFCSSSHKFRGIMFDVGKSKFYKKCKRLLNLLKTRVDTIKKKKKAVHGYLKNDIVDLLKSGLDVNAYGRAEGLLVELNMSSCYDYIGQCITSLLGQLSAMANQRECLDECREAVASLIHAAARFADLPELRDLRTAFNERYGNSLEPFINKEFAMKLRSDPPTKEKKLQLLQEIAQEFTIQWDPMSLEQKTLKPSPPPSQDKPKHRPVDDLEDDGHNQHKRMDDALPERVGHNRGNKMSDVKEYDMPKRNEKDFTYHGRKGSPDDRYTVPSNSEDEVFANNRRNSISQDSVLTSSSSASEDEADTRKPSYYGSIPPPYVKQNAAKESRSKEDTIGFVNAEQNNLQYPPSYKDQSEPVSARTSTLKPPPGREVIGQGNEDRAKGEKARHRLQSILKRYDEDQNDEEENKLDHILIHYSNKRPPHESSKAKANQCPHPGQEEDDTNGATRHRRARANQYNPPGQGNDDTGEGTWYRSRRANQHTPAHAGRRKSASANQGFPPGKQFDENIEAARHRSAKSELPHPPARATSIPSESAAAHEATRGHARAKSSEPDILTGPDLVKAVPDDHKKFLADLVWVHEEDDVCVETNDGIKHCKLIAVHAGLENGKNVEEQVTFLKAKETQVSKVEALSGRKSVWDIPEELIEKPTVVVSGHHGKLHIDGLRLIIDEGGGLENNPVAAIVLPSMKIVRDTDSLVN